jgi:hypothetical protein
MALDTRHATATRNAKGDARAALFNSGYLRLYTAPRPASANDAVGAATLLSEHQFANPAFGAFANGSATANAISADASADNSGVPVWGRAFRSDGTTVIEDYSAGRNGYAADGVTPDGAAVYNINTGAASIAAGASVTPASMTITEPAQGA